MGRFWLVGNLIVFWVMFGICIGIGRGIGISLGVVKESGK